MKKFLILVLALMLTFNASASFCRVNAAPALSAKSAVLIDADTGEILFESNARQRMGMASTTKIMTALTVVSLAEVDTVVSIPREAVGIEGSSVYLCEGETLTVEQLLYALLLSSANDAATALAIHTAGSVEAFASRMNERALSLGLNGTHFVNPHGLYDEQHYTTAYDLAIIAREAMKNDVLRKIFSTYKKELPMCGEPNGRLAVNHNKLLRSYDGAIGIKTGFTKKTGRCLVSAAERDGLTLICVTLNAPDDWRDHTAMLDYGFENFCRVVIADIGEYKYSMPLTGADGDSVILTNTEKLCLTLPREYGNAKYSVSSHCRFLFAPVNKGYVCAEVTVTVDGVSVSSPLAVSEYTAAKHKPRGFWNKLFAKD